MKPDIIFLCRLVQWMHCELVIQILIWKLVTYLQVETFYTIAVELQRFNSAVLN